MLELWPDRVREAGAHVRRTAGVRDVTVYGDRLHITLEEGTPMSAVVADLQQGGYAVLESRAILPSLEDVFIASVKEP
jgi:ABC-2 type transport system ATP-binding protein